MDWILLPYFDFDFDLTGGLNEIFFIFFFIHVGCSGQLARTLTNPHGP